MSSGNPDPISEPLRFQVGDTVYTLVTVAENMYDQSGQELYTKLDQERKLFILSDRCRGRHALVGILTMMLSAWQYDRPGRQLDFDQQNNIASVMERFLVDMDLKDAAIDRLSACPLPAQSSKPSRFWPATRRYALAAALVAVTAGAWWSIATTRSTSNPETPSQTITVSAAFPNLAQGKTLAVASLTNALGTTAAHPVDPAFAFATSDNQIMRADLDGSRRLLTKTPAPVTWLSLSPDGRYVAACDLQGNLYLVSWDAQTLPQQWAADGKPIMLSVQNDGNITWLGDDSSVYVTDPATRITTRLLAYEQLVHASTGVHAAALIRQANSRRTLEFQLDGQTLPLHAQITSTQVIHDFDASEDHRTLIALLSDGVVLIIRKHSDGRYRIQKHQFPAPFGFAQARIARDGRTAIIVTDQLYRFDTQGMRITAQTPLPEAGGPVYDLAWREAIDEIAIARATEGMSWQP